MKILVITDLYPAYKGHSVMETSYVIHDYLVEWQKTEQVAVIRPYYWPLRCQDNKIVEGQINIDGIKIYNHKLFKLPRTEFIFRMSLRKLIDSIGFDPDVIVADYNYNLAHGVYLAKYLKRPLFIGFHNTDINNLNVAPAKYKKYIDFAQGIICRSQVIYNRFLKKFPEYENKTYFTNFGIEADLIKNSNEAVAKFKDIKKIVFISVCGLIPLKNIDICIEALAKAKLNFDWEYRLVGDGSEKERLQKLVCQYGLEKNIIFLGQLPRAKAITEMTKAHIFIMVSAPETFGLAYLEAMASGCVVVGTKEWGIDGIVKNNQNGYLCEPRSVSDLGQTISLIVDKIRLKEINGLIISSIQTVKKLTKKECAAKYLDILQKEIKKNE